MVNPAGTSGIQPVDAHSAGRHGAWAKPRTRGYLAAVHSPPTMTCPVKGHQANIRANWSVLMPGWLVNNFSSSPLHLNNVFPKNSKLFSLMIFSANHTILKW